MRAAVLVALLAQAGVMAASVSDFEGGWSVSPDGDNNIVDYTVCLKSNRLSYRWKVNIVVGTSTFRVGGPITSTSCYKSMCAFVFTCDSSETDGFNLCVDGKACGLFNASNDKVWVDAAGPQTSSSCSASLQYQFAPLAPVTKDASACAGDGLPTALVVVLCVVSAFVVFFVVACCFCRNPSTKPGARGPMTRTHLSGGGAVTPPAPVSAVMNPVPLTHQPGATIAVAPVITAPPGKSAPYNPPPPPPASMATAGYPGQHPSYISSQPHHAPATASGPSPYPAASGSYPAAPDSSYPAGAPSAYPGATPASARTSHHPPPASAYPPSNSSGYGGNQMAL